MEDREGLTETARKALDCFAVEGTSRRERPAQQTIRLEVHEWQRVKREARDYGVSASAYLGIAMRNLWDLGVELRMVPPLPRDPWEPGKK